MYLHPVELLSLLKPDLHFGTFTQVAVWGMNLGRKRQKTLVHGDRTQDEQGNGMAELLEECSSEKGIGKCPKPSAAAFQRPIHQDTQALSTHAFSRAAVLSLPP